MRGSRDNQFTQYTLVHLSRACILFTKSLTTFFTSTIEAKQKLNRIKPFLEEVKAHVEYLAGKLQIKNIRNTHIRSVLALEL